MISFIYILIASVFSELTTLTNENYEEILDRKGKNPLFLKVWSPWCSHCQSLAPVIFQLSEIEELNSTIEFGELNCDMYPSQCKKIADSKVPSFFYYDSDLKDAVHYFGDDSIDSFKFFLKKQLNKWLVNITNEKERNEVIALSDYVISYIFSIPLNDPALEMVINFSKQYKETNKRFFIENNSSITEKSLIAYRSHNCFTKYDGNWTKKSVFDFIFQNYFPLIENSGPEVFMLSSFFNKTIVMIGISDPKTREKLNDWNLDPRSDVQYCVDNTFQPSSMSFKLVFNLNYKKNYIAVIDFTRKVAWKSESIQFNKNGVDQLINMSLNDKELKFVYGPGNPHNSIIQKTRFFYINHFGLDWLLYLILTVIVLFAIITIILLILYSCLTKEGKNSSSNKNKNKNE